MKRVLFYIVILLTILLSCQQIDNKKLNNNQNLKEIFSKNEIETLNEILIFFDNIVVISTETLFIDSAYHKYSERLRFNNSSEEFWNKLKEYKIENDIFLESIENKNVFNELWSIEFGINYETKDTLRSYLIPNLNGKYMKLLDHLSKDNPKLVSYKESVMASGSIPPSLIAGFPNIHPELDFSDETIRLFVALHYLTIKTYSDAP